MKKALAAFVATLMAVLPLTTVFAFGATALIQGGLSITGTPTYVPSSGTFRINKEYAYSRFLWNSAWTMHLLRPEAYEHEFRVRNTGFARYANHWSSNLPSPYPDMEDDFLSSSDTYDEFVVGSDNAEAILPWQTYWMFVDLIEQDTQIRTSNTILEAEHLFDWPMLNEPISWHNIAVFTAPMSNGVWGTSGSTLQNDTTLAAAMPVAETPIDTYVADRQSVLRTLAAKNPLTRERATISLSAYADFATVKAFLERHALRAESVWYRAIRHGFSGGFCVHGSLPASVERVIRGLEENMASTKAQLGTAPADERPMLEKSIAKHKMMIEAFNSGSAKAYGLDVEAEVGRLYALQADPMTRLVDVRPSTTTRSESQGQGRPLQPSSKER